MSDIVCNTANRLPNLRFRADVANAFSVSGTVRASPTDEPCYEYLIARIGSVWASTLDSSACTTPFRRAYVIRPASKPKVGATERLVGSLADVIPELKETSEQDIERRLRRMRQ